MSFRLSSWCRVGLGLAVAGWGGWHANILRAQEAPTARRTEAVKPVTRVPRADSGPAALQNHGLMRLEQQLTQAFEFLVPRSSLEPVMTPTQPFRPATPVLSPREREELDKRKNWAFANPDDLSAQPKLEEMLNVPEYAPNGSEKKHVSSLERFYKDLERRKSALARHDPLAPEDPRQLDSLSGVPKDPNSAEEQNLPTTVRNSEQNLKKLLQEQSPGSAFEPAPRNVLDLFGLGERQATPEEERAQKVYLKDYQDWLNRADAAPATSPSNPLLATDPSRPTLPATVPLNPLAPLSRPDNYDPTLGAANPAVMVSTPQDITAKVLNQWNPLYTLPKAQPVTTPPPKPAFDVPRRQVNF